MSLTGIFAVSAATPGGPDALLPPQALNAAAVKIVATVGNPFIMRARCVCRPMIGVLRVRRASYVRVNTHFGRCGFLEVEFGDAQGRDDPSIRVEVPPSSVVDGVIDVDGTTAQRANDRLTAEGGSRRSNVQSSNDE